MEIKPTLKRIFATVLVMVMLTSVGSIFATAEKVETVTIDTPLLYSANSYGNVDVDGLIAALNKGFKEYKTAVDISSFNVPYTEDGVVLLREIMSGNLPECFHIDSQFSITPKGGKINTVLPEYNYTNQEFEAMTVTLMAEVNKLLRGLKSSTLTDVEKALVLHDRIALECEYDYQNYLNQTVPLISHTMYGALVNDVAVCQGYALAYGYLLDALNIKNEYCGSLNLNHAWNIVYIDNKPYHVDVTYDDPVWDISGRVTHNNFLRSTQGIKSTGHNATDFISTPTDTTYDEYFWQESTAAFVLVDGAVYYEDDNKHIKRFSDREVIYDITARWSAGVNSFWNGDYTRLATDGYNLLFSTNDAIYKLDLSTGKAKRIYKPILSGSFNVYGFKLQGETLIIDLATSPNFTSDTKKLYEIKADYDLTGPAYTPGNINDDSTIDLGDVVILAQCFAGWDVTCNQDALDVNGDGLANLNDVVHLAQYVAGWNVQLY